MQSIPKFLITAAATLLCCIPVIAAPTVGDIEIDGVRYENVRWGPVNQGKVVIFHNRGNAIIPIEKLPPDIQSQLGVAPTTSKTDKSSDQRQIDTREQAEWQSYLKDRSQTLYLNGELRPRAKFAELTGFLTQPDKEISADGLVTGRGWILELAEPKKELPANTLMGLRPGLWQHTGIFVYLRDFEPVEEAGDLIRVYGLQKGEHRALPAYELGSEPTLEQWQKLRAR